MEKIFGFYKYKNNLYIIYGVIILFNRSYSISCLTGNAQISGKMVGKYVSGKFARYRRRDILSIYMLYILFIYLSI